VIRVGSVSVVRYWLVTGTVRSSCSSVSVVRYWLVTGTVR
jgi:hypothetical protein